MPESVGVFRSLETGPKSPVEGVAVNSAVAVNVRSVVPARYSPEEYIAGRIGMSSGEATGERDTLRVTSPTGKRGLTLRFFRPSRVGENARFTSLTAKGVGIGDGSMETSGEEPFGLFGQREAEKEQQTSESLYREGVRVSRVAAIVSLDRERLADWIRQQPRGKFSLETMLQRLKPGEKPAVVVRFDNPRWSDLFNAKARGPYSAQAITRLGAQCLYAEMDMANGGDLLGAVYQYPRSQEAAAALKEIMTKKRPSQEMLREYLLLEAFFSGYNHRKLIDAGAKLPTARAAQDMLVGGALFTDFEGLNMLRGSPLPTAEAQRQGDAFSGSVAQMIVGRGYKALRIQPSTTDMQEVGSIFQQGFQNAA